MTPTEWFDAFPSNPRMDGHKQWCARHWGPCPVLGANGVQASVIVLELFVNRILVTAGISSTDLEAANAKLDEIGKLCCWLGDEEMYQIWGQCPPAEGERLLDDDN